MTRMMRNEKEKKINKLRRQGKKIFERYKMNTRCSSKPCQYSAHKQGNLVVREMSVNVHTEVSAQVRMMSAGIIKFSKGELSLPCLFGVYSSGRWEDRMDTNTEQS